jgi:hypothetical protein
VSLDSGWFKTIVGIGQGTQVNVEQTGWFSTGADPGTRVLTSDPRTGEGKEFVPATITDAQRAVIEANLKAHGLDPAALAANRLAAYNSGLARAAALYPDMTPEQRANWYQHEHDSAVAYCDHGQTPYVCFAEVAATTSKAQWSMQTGAKGDYGEAITVYPNLTAAATVSAFGIENPTITLTQADCDAINIATTSYFDPGTKPDGTPASPITSIDPTLFGWESHPELLQALVPGDYQADQLSDQQLGKYVDMSGNGLLVGVPIGLPDGLARGIAIARGADPDVVLNGEKQLSFTTNGAFPELNTTTTNDTHIGAEMLAGATYPADDKGGRGGQPMSASDLAVYVQQFYGAASGSGYRYITESIMQGAAALDPPIVGHQYQAIMWVGDPTIAATSMSAKKMYTVGDLQKNSKLDVQYPYRPYTPDGPDFERLDKPDVLQAPITDLAKKCVVTAKNYAHPPWPKDQRHARKPKWLKDRIARGDFKKFDMPTWFKSFGSPGNTQNRVEGGRFGESAGVLQPDGSVQLYRGWHPDDNSSEEHGTYWTADKSNAQLYSGQREGSHVISVNFPRSAVTGSNDAFGVRATITDGTVADHEVMQGGQWVSTTATKGFGDPGSTQTQGPDGRFGVGSTTPGSTAAGLKGNQIIAHGITAGLHTPEGMMHDALVARSEVSGLPTRDIGRIDGVWESSPTDSSLINLTLQAAAGDRFGSTVSPDLQARLDAAQPSGNRATNISQDTAASYIDAQYQTTQAWLAANNITEVTLYRGVTWNSQTDPNNPLATPMTAASAISSPSATINVTSNPLTSWSYDAQNAESFANGMTSHGVDSGAVVQATIPAANILAVPATGMASAYWQEVVVVTPQGGYDVSKIPSGADYGVTGRATKSAHTQLNLDEPPINEAWLRTKIEKGFNDPGSTQTQGPDGRFTAGNTSASDLEARAIAHFGAADELVGQQFVTPNGTILNMKDESHAQIKEVMGGDVNTAESRAINAGFLRSSLGTDVTNNGDLGLVLELTVPMTDEQKSTVMQGVQNAGGVGYVAVDVTSAGIHSVNEADDATHLLFSDDTEQPTTSDISVMMTAANAAAQQNVTKGFGDPGSTQERQPDGTFGAGSGDAHAAMMTPHGRVNSDSEEDAQYADTHSMYASENMVRSASGEQPWQATVAFTSQADAQARGDELWAKYGDGDPTHGPVVVFSNPATPDAMQAARMGTIGMTEVPNGEAVSHDVYMGTPESGERPIMVTLYTGGQNEMTLDHEMAHAVSMTGDTNNDFGVHGADFRSTYDTILRGEGMTTAADQIAANGGSAADAMMKGTRVPIASITYNGKTIVCYGDGVTKGFGDPGSTQEREPGGTFGPSTLADMSDSELADRAAAYVANEPTTAAQMDENYKIEYEIAARAGRAPAASADVAKRFGDPGSTQTQDAGGRFTVGSGAPRDAANLKYPELHASDLTAGGEGTVMLSRDEFDARAAAGEDVRYTLATSTNSPLMTRAEFQASAARGEDIVNNAIANGSPPVNLMTGANIQAAVDSVQEKWGGITIDAHGGGIVSQSSQPPDPLSVSIGGSGNSVIISAAMGTADPGTLMAAMQQAQTQFADQLQAQGAALGIFRDETSGTIQIDPVMVVQGVPAARDVGAYTGATGGAYRFSDGNGYWPGHVA